MRWDLFLKDRVIIGKATKIQDLFSDALGKFRFWRARAALGQDGDGRNVLLLAHNGFKFEFLVLYIELKRKVLLHFSPEYLHFGDTLVWIKELKRRREIPHVLQNGSLSLEIFVQVSISGFGKAQLPQFSLKYLLRSDRALSKIVFQSDLKASVEALPVQTCDTLAKQMLQTEKMVQKMSFPFSSSFISSLRQMAKMLDKIRKCFGFLFFKKTAMDTIWISSKSFIFQIKVRRK